MIVENSSSHMVWQIDHIKDPHLVRFDAGLTDTIGMICTSDQVRENKSCINEHTYIGIGTASNTMSTFK